MADLFEACEGAPVEAFAGDFWTWRMDSLASASDPAEHSLAYTLTPAAGGEVIALATATADGDGWLVEVAPATTAAIPPGKYRLVARVTRTADGAVAVADSAALTVHPDPATSTADTRTRNRRILEAIEARIEGRISKDAESYTIEGRTIARTPLEILHKLVGHYRRAVAREEGRPPFHARRVDFK